MRNAWSKRRARLIRSAALAILLTGVLSVPSSAAPEPPVPDRVPMAAAATPQALPDVPGAEDVPPADEVATAAGSVTTTQVTVANRSRMAIEFGQDNPIWAILYYAEYNVPLDEPTVNLPSCADLGYYPDSPSCVPYPYQPSCATDDPSTQMGSQYFRNRVYPIRPLEGGGADVGFLGKTRVNLLAFGSVPVSATLTLRTPRVDGEVQYLTSHIWTIGGNGTPPARMPGCDPSYRAPETDVALLEGEAEIWISDLVVDGVPVNVGRQCRTTEPAELELWGDFSRGDYNATDGGPLGAEPGIMPHAFTLDDPQYRQQNGRTFGPSKGIDVPPFTDCGTGDQDFSPLVSAAASGPNNPVRAEQGTLVISAGGGAPIKNPTGCGISTCPLPAPELPELPPLPWGNGDTH